MEKILLFAFILLIVQGLFSYSQFKNYRNTVSKLKSKGLIGLGREKGFLKAGNITILVCNREGKIITGEKMEGITVFSRFAEIKDISGISIAKLKEEYVKKKDKPGKKAMIQAVEDLERKLVSN